MISRLLKVHFTDKPKPEPRHKEDTETAITIKVADVRYDVEQALYKYGQMQNIKDETIEALTIQEEETEWFESKMKRCMSVAVSKMKPYLKMREKMASNESGCPVDEYDFIIHSGRGWTGAATTIATGPHDYAVNTILGDLFRSGGDVSRASMYDSEADTAMRLAYSELNSYDVEPILMDEL